MMIQMGKVMSDSIWFTLFFIFHTLMQIKGM